MDHGTMASRHEEGDGSFAAKPPLAAGPEGQAASLPPRLLVAAVFAIGDLLILYGGISLAVLGRMAISPWLPIAMNPGVYAGVAVALLFVPIVYASAGLYPGYGQTGVERLRKRVTATVLCFAAMILFDRVAQDAKWSRGILLGVAAFSTFAIPLWDALARRVLARRGWWGEAVVVLGPSARRHALVEMLLRNRSLGWVPVAEGELDGSAKAVPGVSIAFLLMPDRKMDIAALADSLPYPRVVLMPDFGSMQSLWVSVRDLGSHLGLEMRRNLLLPGNQLMKRLIDLLLGFFSLLAVAPVIALFAALVFCVSPGPVFYVQTREGRGGEAFRMWKLRTMRRDADAVLEGMIAGSETFRAEWQASMKLRQDPRVIPILGAFMRRFSIDELPQLWHVLAGQMSLVGARPLPAYHADRLGEGTKALRRGVRPGMTGLWQVSERSRASVDEMEALDSYYVRNWSLWLDIDILLRTVETVLGGRGAW